MNIRQAIMALPHFGQKPHLARPHFMLLAALVSGLFATAPTQAAAAALWNGKPIEIEWAYPAKGEQYGNIVDVTANPGVQVLDFVSSNQTFNIDFTDSGVVVSAARTGCCFNSAAFNGLEFIDYTDALNFDNSPPVLAANSWNGFGASDVTYDPHDIYLNFSGLAFTQAASSVTLDVAAVPEPGTWTMMILGIGALGATLRSRRKLSGAVTA